MKTLDEIALSHNPRGEIVTDEHYALMSETTFSQLLAYDTSLPTGTTIGKRWSRTERYARNRHSGGIYRVFGGGDITKVYMGEYVASDKPGHVSIHWREVLIA